MFRALRVGVLAGLLAGSMIPAFADGTFELGNDLSQAACCGCESCSQCDCDCCPSNWYASFGGVVLHRSRPDAGAIVTRNPNTAIVISNAADFDFGWDAGFDVTVGYHLPSCNSLEVRFFDVDGADATSQYTTPGAFIGAGFIGPGGTAIASRYLTKLHSTEINFLHPTTERLTLLAGFRWVELRDDLYTNIGAVAASRYEYNNHLYGAQIGANLALTDSCNPWQINVVGKAGIFGIVADGGIDEFLGANYIGGFRSSGTDTAFVGEIGISLAYQLTSHIALRGGYQLLWLDGVALASDNASMSLLNPSLLANRFNDGHLFYHGATFGIDFTW